MGGIMTIKVGGREVALRKWPMRPGFRFSGIVAAFIGRVLGSLDLSGSSLAINPAIQAAFTDANAEAAIEMIAEGLDFADRNEAQKFADSLGFEDGCTVLEAVVRHNLSFLKGRIAELNPAKPA